VKVRKEEELNKERGEGAEIKLNEYLIYYTLNAESKFE
jgi:hypothetical protein